MNDKQMQSEVVVGSTALLGSVFPRDRKETYIQVFAQDGDPVFICGADGHITGSMIEEIEKDLNENRAEILDDGGGEYLFTVTRQDAEYGFEGRMESPAYFELSFVTFRDLPNAKFRGDQP